MAREAVGASLDLADLQGLLRSGYSSLPYAEFRLYTIRDPGFGRDFVGSLAGSVTSAAQRQADPVTQVAFTATGLAALGIPPDIIGQFSLEFVGGMTAPSRSAFLGDVGDSAPDRWSWGGPRQPRVDVVVMVYASSADGLQREAAELDELATRHELSAAGVLRTAAGTTTEPFGFKDGIAQPRLAEFASARRRTTTAGPFSGRAVAIGEFVLGYPNEYGQLTERPIVPPSMDPAGLLPQTESGGSSNGDLGRNGSYLVLRTLRQKVDEFWNFAECAARGVEGLTAEALAAKFVGRWPSGAPLVLAPTVDDPELAANDDFGYHATDPQGYACPLGAHVRRANPRDSLDPNPGTGKSQAITDRHRLLRRGRVYGPTSKLAGSFAGIPGTSSVSAPNVEQGLHFMALNASLARQFEFVQHTWLNSAKFAGLYEDVDVIAGSRAPSAATFTIQRKPVRVRFNGVPAFVQVAGGAYFFLPGLRALDYLANGPFE